jgi:short-subunit dehydrogenase
MNVIITGGSKGMGKAIALKFATEKNNLILCSRTESTLKETQKEILSKHPEVTVNIFAADLTNKDELKKFAAFCLSFGAPDILINNAGTYQPGKCIDQPEVEFEQLMNVNFYSAFYLTRSLVPEMIANKHGHIFNICSIASLKAYRDGGGYGVSKFALYGFSQNLRLELMNHNIKVTAVFPGAVLTDSWAGFDNSSNRIMEVEDIAEMVFASTRLSPQAVVEDIIIRPQLGDL